MSRLQDCFLFVLLPVNATFGKPPATGRFFEHCCLLIPQKSGRGDAFRREKALAYFCCRTISMASGETTRRFCLSKKHGQQIHNCCPKLLRNTTCPVKNRNACRFVSNIKAPNHLIGGFFVYQSCTERKSFLSIEGTFAP